MIDNGVGWESIEGIDPARGSLEQWLEGTDFNNISEEDLNERVAGAEIHCGFFPPNPVGESSEMREEIQSAQMYIGLGEQARKERTNYEGMIPQARKERPYSATKPSQ